MICQKAVSPLSQYSNRKEEYWADVRGRDEAKSQKRSLRGMTTGSVR